MRSLAFAVFALGLLVCANAAADQPDLSAMDPRARAHLERGVRHFTDKAYEQAIDEFSKGYSIEPGREIAFAWAQAERLRGNCAAAIGLYRKVLAADPSQSQAELARFHLRRCEPLVPTPWYRDVIGDALAISGAIGLGVGVGYYIESAQSEQVADGATSYRAHRDAIANARSERTTAWIVGGTGSALVVGAIARYIWRKKPAATREAIAPTVGGFELMIRF